MLMCDELTTTEAVLNVGTHGANVYCLVWHTAKVERRNLFDGQN